MLPEATVPESWNAKSRAVPDAEVERRRLGKQLEEMSARVQERFQKLGGTKALRGSEVHSAEVKGKKVEKVLEAVDEEGEKKPLES